MGLNDLSTYRLSFANDKVIIRLSLLSILFKRFYVKWNFFLQVISVQTTRCGFIHVYIQGNLENRNGKTMVMTVHDVGTNCKFFLLKFKKKEKMKIIL